MKESRDQVDILHLEKYQIFFQNDCIVFWWGWRGMSKVPKITSLQCLSNVSKKRAGINVNINIKIFLKLIP